MDTARNAPLSAVGRLVESAPFHRAVIGIILANALLIGLAMADEHVTMADGGPELAEALDAWEVHHQPALAVEGKNPLSLDSKAPKIPLKDYVYNETRYSSLVSRDEERAEMLLKLAQEDVLSRWKQYEQMAAMSFAKD